MTNRLTYQAPELEEYGTLRDLTLGGHGHHPKPPPFGKRAGVNDLVSLWTSQNNGCNANFNGPISGPLLGCPQS